MVGGGGGATVVGCTFLGGVWGHAPQEFLSLLKVFLRHSESLEVLVAVNRFSAKETGVTASMPTFHLI